MANEQNLIPGQHKLTVEEQSRGGTNSGAARRRKRSLKEAADLFLSLPVTDTKTYNKMARAGVVPEDIDYQMAVIIGLTTKAMKGDAKAAKVLMEMLGGAKADEAQDNALEKLDEVLGQIGGVV